MTIAVNAGYPEIYAAGNTALYITECFLKLAQQYPQHRFIFFCDSATAALPTSKNIVPVIIGRATKNPLLLQYRLNYTIPALLRRHKADVFVSGGNYCSLRSKLPQCIITNELSFQQLPRLYSSRWLRFYNKNTTRFFAKAAGIVTTSQYLKNSIAQKYAVAENKIAVAFYGINDLYKPLSWQQKDRIKETYTAGVEYFLFSGNVYARQSLVPLLKAFSFFKKRQKSNMQLLIASKKQVQEQEFMKALATFKFRNEVKIMDNLAEEKLAAITGAAYALIAPVPNDGFGSPLTEALRSDTPVIAANTPFNQEVCGNAALYINPDDFNDIADKMMLVFKDENRRNNLLAEGRQQLNPYTWATTTEVLWQAIVKSCKQ